jgi:hypothetical protein
MVITVCKNAGPHRRAFFRKFVALATAEVNHKVHGLELDFLNFPTAYAIELRSYECLSLKVNSMPIESGQGELRAPVEFREVRLSAWRGYPLARTHGTP